MVENKKPLILIVEQDDETASIIKHSLSLQSIESLIAKNGNEALELVKNNIIDLAVINYNIPIISGMGLCTIFKSKNFSKSVLVLFISKKDEKLEQIKGIDKSFDDYLILPFPISDLILKVTELVKRKNPNFKTIKFEHGDLSFDPETLTVSKSGKEIRLGPTEVRILQCFMGNPKKIFTRHEIVSEVWGYNGCVDLRTVDVHINRLRVALNNENVIKTIRTMGYTLERNISSLI